MAAYFFDIDGTLCFWGSNNFIPESLATIKKLAQDGHQIILTTRRGDDYDRHSRFGRLSVEKLVEELRLEHSVNVLYVLYNIESPRIVINDDGCTAIKCEKDKGFTL